MRSFFASSIRGATLSALLASAAAAQLPSASVAAFGMAGNFTAMGRGYEAIRWNPANLAMPGRPFISFGTAIAGGNIGLEPVDVSTIHGYNIGPTVDDSTKMDWVERARLAGGQRIRADGGATYLGLTVGPLGFQVGSSVYSTMNLAPDAWEAMLFGNAGASGGQPKNLDLTGTSVRSGAFTTGAMSLALPVPIKLPMLFGNQHAAIGVTGKYIFGHALVVADDQGSTFAGQTITLNFPILMPDSTIEKDFFDPLGRGFGADVSFAWSGGPWKIGFLAENVFSTFAWDTTRFAFLPGTGAYTATSDTNDFEERPYSESPSALKDIVTNQTFKPGFSAGVAFTPMSSLTLTADMRSYTGAEHSIIIGSRSHVGVGMEWRPLGFLPLRGGVASVADGWQAGAGFGLRFAGYELGLSTSIRRRGQATESGMMFGVVGIGR